MSYGNYSVMLILNDGSQEKEIVVKQFTPEGVTPNPTLKIPFNGFRRVVVAEGNYLHVECRKKEENHEQANV